MNFKKDQLISHFKIIEKLEDGEIGNVYKAEDLNQDKVVALKFVPSYLRPSERQLERFACEAKAASLLNHKNMCTIHEIGETDDHQLFFCMPYYPGETLKLKIEKQNLKINEAMDITIQIAEGLSQAHKMNIIHGDIQPANIMFTENDIVKIYDFGVARLMEQIKIEESDTMIGKIAYMSPEQIQGEVVDKRSDIWSLGVILYEMIADCSPFEAGYESATLYGILNEEPAPISNYRSFVPFELTEIIARCLEKKPSARYQKVDHLMEDLINVSDKRNVKYSSDNEQRTMKALY